MSEKHRFIAFGIDDPRYYAGICSVCGDLHPRSEAPPKVSLTSVFVSAGGTGATSVTNAEFYESHWNKDSRESVNAQAQRLYPLAVQLQVTSAYSPRGFATAMYYWHKKAARQQEPR